MPLESFVPDTGANGQSPPATNVAPAPGRGPASGVPGELRNLLSDIEYLIKETTSITGEDLAMARAKLGERVAAAKHSVEEMKHAVALSARKNADVANRYVHEQPWQVIGLGAALGFLFGFLLARRAPS